MIPQVLAWTTFIVGLVCINTFVGIYLYRVRPWRSRPGEPMAVKRVRTDVLAWSCSIAAFYDGAVLGFIQHHSGPDDGFWPIVVKIIVAGLSAHRLTVYLREVWRSRT